MRKHFSAIAFAALVLSCTALAGRARNGYLDWSEVPGATCHSTSHTDYDASDFADLAEQEQVVRATTAWEKLSGAGFNDGGYTQGQVTLTAYFADPPPDAKRIHRVLSTDQIVLDHEAESRELVAGWHASDGDLFMVMDRIQLPHLHAILMHEMGHGLPLRWPACLASLEPPEACIHSPDPNAIMGAEANSTEDFTPSDLYFCRASCFCP